MKKLSVLILVMMIGITAFGQGKSKGKKDEKSQNLVTRLQKMLKLDEAQIEKLNKIQDETILKISEIRAKGKELKDQEYVKTEVKKVRDISEEKIKTILTDEQKLKFENWQANRQEKRDEKAQKQHEDHDENLEENKKEGSKKQGEMRGGNRKEGKGKPKKSN